MRCVSYNIQYGIGLDGRYDLPRIVDAVRGADVIALQEVTRNSPNNGGRDMVAEIRDLLPDHFAVYASPFEADMGSAIENGRVVDRRFQFGNMVLSRTPILASRNLLLPRMRTYRLLNLQRGALETVMDTPLGPLRFYSVHLDHTSPAERIAQLRCLREKALAYPNEGGALSGLVEFGFPEPAHPEGFVLMGDFNFSPGSPEYLEMTGMPDREFGVTERAGLPVDAARLDPDFSEHQTTWADPRDAGDRSRGRTLDYCFVHGSLAASVRRLRVDMDAVGSDHRPVWLELG